MNPRVKNVKALPNFFLELIFQNGEQKVFNAKPYLEYGLFQQLKDPHLFRSARAVGGTVEWQNGLDLCPDTLYEESNPVAKKKFSPRSV